VLLTELGLSFGFFDGGLMAAALHDSRWRTVTVLTVKCL